MSVHTQILGLSAVDTIGRGGFVSIATLSLLTVFMATLVWLYPSRQTILERPIIDLMDQLNLMIILTNFTCIYKADTSLLHIWIPVLYLTIIDCTLSVLLSILIGIATTPRLIALPLINITTLLWISAGNPEYEHLFPSFIFMNGAFFSQVLVRYLFNGWTRDWKHVNWNLISGGFLCATSALITHLSLQCIQSFSGIQPIYLDDAYHQPYLEATSYRVYLSQVIPILGLLKPLINCFYYVKFAASIPSDTNARTVTSSTFPKHACAWNIAFPVMFLCSRKAPIAATLSLCLIAGIFRGLELDIVTITVERPVAISNRQFDIVSNVEVRRSKDPGRAVDYEAVNVFRITHTFSDIQFILPSRVEILPEGYRRVVWECSCGETLATHFQNTNPQALKTLELELRGIKSRTQTHLHQHGSNKSVSIQTHATPILPGRPHSTGSTNREQHDSDPESSFTKGVIANSDGSIGKCQEVSSVKVKKYFEVCVNVGRHIVNLGEINISAIASDDQLFDEIWKTYRGIKGSNWRETLHKWFLEPDDVKFVFFGVLKRHQVGIYGQPLEIPPRVEVDEGRYHYYECPMEVLPPMPGNIFLHYLEHAKRKSKNSGKFSGYHTDSTFLNRLPKKLERSIFSETLGLTGSAISYGWGIHIIERPSTFAQNLVAGLVAIASVLICLVVFGITWSTASLENAIGVGQYTAGVLALLNTAIYFSLQAYFTSFSPRKY
ncbi:hypothetical protein F5Y13DRAFT_190798 [Hypoxylon sp. FL1857]|nr:hypothetical protein F5Y13DRAFT_190798 [Hypoxylon sp. FL1857]